MASSFFNQIPSQGAETPRAFHLPRSSSKRSPPSMTTSSPFSFLPLPRPSGDLPLDPPTPHPKRAHRIEANDPEPRARKKKKRGSRREESSSSSPKSEERDLEDGHDDDDDDDDGGMEGSEDEGLDGEDGEASEDEALGLLMKRNLGKAESPGSGAEGQRRGLGLGPSGNLTSNGRVTMDSAELWAVLFEHTFQQTYSLELFEKAFAISPRVCQHIWGFLTTKIPLKSFLFHRKHLLWGLYHLKHYSTNDHTRFSVCGRTFRLWSWKMIEVLFIHLDEVSLAHRLSGTKLHNHNEHIFLSISHIPCKIRKPSDVSIQREFYSTDCKRFILKYECCTRNGDGKFCWAYGPVPGKTSDLSILKEGGLLDLVGKDEKLLSEEQFPEHVRIKRITSFAKGEEDPTEGSAAGDFFQGFHQASQESLKVLKGFECLSGVWRYEMAHHKIAFVACLHLSNLIIDDHSKRD